MKKMFILAFCGLFGIGIGQNGWDSGEISFNYGSPFPNHSVIYSGAFLSSQILNQGVGGFEISLSDTNFLSLVAYDIHDTGSDTLADIFTIIIQDSVEIEQGTYVIGGDPGAIKGFIWLRDVNPELIAGMIDTTFSLDSLSALDPYISLTGQIEITELNETTISGNFAGAMVNTSMDFQLVSGGSFSLANTLPALLFDQGMVSLTIDASPVVIAGELNPLQSEQGVGVVEIQQGDTLITNLFAYGPTDDGSLSIYGLAFKTLTGSYPEPGTQLTYNVGSGPDELPMALPYLLEDASIEQLMQLMASDSLPNMTDFENLYLPSGPSTAILGYQLDETAFAMLPGVSMVNTGGNSFWLTEDWSLGWLPLTSIDEELIQKPGQVALLGPVFPNPFNSSTVVPFKLTESSHLRLMIYNVLGREVVATDMGEFSPGSYQYKINMNLYDLPGGLYYFKMNSVAESVGSGSFIYLK